MDQAPHRNRRKRKERSQASPVLKKILLGILTALLVTIVIALLINRWVIRIDPKDGENQHLELGTAYQENGAEAYLTGTILPFVQIEVPCSASGSVDGTKPGTYTITYTASYGRFSNTLKKMVDVSDTEGPKITLVSDPDHYTLFGHPYEEEGCKAVDATDGDVSAKVEREEKDGIVYYRAVDSLGNRSEVERKIVYDDRKGPEIRLTGGINTTWFTGQGPWQDDYQAVDDLDGDVTDKVEVTGTYDPNVPGDYTLTYTVSDAHGNKSEVTRNLHITDQAEWNAKTIYLTFDDGPGAYTDHLLDILDQYGVKATFFTTSAYPGYRYCIGEEAARGHTVAVHTASHVYGQIYASPEAYWADFDAQNQVIQEQTGHTTDLFRFPGGSSNTVSANYCQGVMSELVKEARNKGLVYEDWNVSSGDAGETTDTDQVFKNVTCQVAANTAAGIPSVVLQHDVKDFSVAAVGRIIEWGQANGYTFLPITANSFTAHHGVQN